MGSELTVANYLFIDGWRWVVLNGNHCIARFWYEEDAHDFAALKADMMKPTQRRRRRAGR